MWAWSLDLWRFKVTGSLVFNILDMLILQHVSYSLAFWATTFFIRGVSRLNIVASKLKFMKLSGVHEMHLYSASEIYNQTELRGIDWLHVELQAAPLAQT